MGCGGAGVVNSGKLAWVCLVVLVYVYNVRV